MKTADHFVLFGLPRRFDIDRDDLERRYRELSREHHPDKHARGSDGDRLAAVQKTTDINAAYKVLRDDFSRAEHLLRRAGIETSEHEQQDNRQTVDASLLTEIMELREALDDARQSKDHATVEKLATDVNARVDKAWDRMKVVFGRYGVDATEAQLRPLANELTSLRYYRRVLEEVSNILDEEV
ncbi:MAG: Fe-S protein assembly co-chaperone HscB [Polyangia bacterium]